MSSQNESLSSEYWQNRYLEDKTGWDIGYASPALVEYASNFPKETKILIPGAGNAYEAMDLWNKGFENLYILDWAEEPLKSFSRECPDFPSDNIILADFFKHREHYDLILEQTFFCALKPELRDAYMSSMKSLLKPEGILAGVLFNFPLTEKGPPYGGSYDEYKERFEENFEVIKIEKAYNSIPPRKDSEYFFIVKNKD